MSQFYVPSPQYKLTREDGRPTDDYYRFFSGLGSIFGADGVLIPSAGGTGVNNGVFTIGLAGSLTIASHGGTIAFPVAGTTQTMPSASKTLMATDFSNASGAGGDLSGSYPNPAVAKINGAVLGTVTATLAHVLVADGAAWQSVAMSGGATINSAGVVTLSGSLPPNGSAGGDLSGSYPNPDVAKINTVALGTTTATAGHILVGDGAAWQSVAVSGAVALSSTGATTVTHGANASSTPANPAGSASATGLMMGLALAITPATSGNIYISISGNCNNSNSGGSFIATIRTGTGAAPGNGAALTGTVRGSSIQGTTAAVSQNLPFTCSAIVTGLVVATTYWIDLALGNNGGGTATASNLSLSAFEL